MQTRRRTDAEGARRRDLTRLDWRRTVLATLPFMGALAFWQAYDGLIPLMLKNTFGLADTVTGGFLALDNVFALILLPLTGAWSDRVMTRRGRRTPFILVGGALAVVLVPLIAVFEHLHVFIGFTVALVACLVVLSIYRSPSVALMPDVTPRPVRAKADAFNSLMAAVGGVIVLMAISALVPGVAHPNYIPVFLVLAGLLLLTLVIFAVFFNEPREAAAMREESRELGIPEEEIDASDEGGNERERDPVRRRSLLLVLACVFMYFMSNNAVTSGFSRYAEAMWGMQGGGYATVQSMSTVAALVAYMPMAALSCRIGRRATCVLGGLLMACSGLVMTTQTALGPVAYACVLLFGIGTAAVSLAVYPMVTELATARTTGRYTGYYYTASMLAQILTPVLSGAVMQFVGYQQLFLYAAVFALASCVPMAFVRKVESLTMDEVRSRQEAAEG